MHLRAVRVDARYAELVVLVARDVRLEEREVVGIARDEREIADLLLSDRSPQIDLARLRDRRLARYGDRLGDVPDTELDVDQRRLACGQGDALLLERLEPLKLRATPCSGPAAAAERDRRRLVGDRGRVVPVSMFVTVTITPGRAAPLLSRTVPSMFPFAACACAAAVCGDTSASTALRTAIPNTRNMMWCPPGQRESLPDLLTHRIRGASPLGLPCTLLAGAPDPRSARVALSLRSFAAVLGLRQQGACESQEHRGQARSIQLRLPHNIHPLRDLSRCLDVMTSKDDPSHEQRRSSRYLRWAVGCLLALVSLPKQACPKT